MELIKSYEKYVEIVREFKKYCNTYVSNLFLLPQEIKSIINDGRLYFVRLEGVLLLLIDEGYYLHLYYYWDLRKDIHFPQTKKNILIEQIYNENGILEQAEVVRSKCLNAGAKYKKKSYQIEATEEQRNNLLEKEYVKSKLKLQEQGLTVACARTDDLTFIFALWRKYLDVYDFRYLSADAIETMLKNQNILVIQNSANEILASECVELSGRRSLGYHLVVDHEARGKGLGKTLMMEWYNIANQNQVKICNVWVAENNKVSMSCHLKAGTKTGKVSEQYVVEI